MCIHRECMRFYVLIYANELLHFCHSLRELRASVSATNLVESWFYMWFIRKNNNVVSTSVQFQNAVLSSCCLTQHLVKHWIHLAKICFKTSSAICHTVRQHLALKEEQLRSEVRVSPSVLSTNQNLLSSRSQLNSWTEHRLIDFIPGPKMLKDLKLELDLQTMTFEHLCFLVHESIRLYILTYST